MKAILCSKSGPPEILRLVDVQMPRPGNGEILVQVHYATVTSGDVKLRRFPRLFLALIGLIFGFKPMKVLGIEYSGVVTEVGPEVTSFRVGEAVVGTTTGLSYGANAEYVVVPVEPRLGVLVRKPEELSFREAAANVVGPLAALQLLNRARIEQGTRVLVYGASGSVGAAAVQLAKHFGAKVTGVCSTPNLNLVSSLGADVVIDYTTTDFVSAGGNYDVVFDAVGKISRKLVQPVLSNHGSFLSVKSSTKEKVEELEFIQSLAAQGSLKAPIDREISLAEIPEAHAYVESGRKKGNIVVAVHR
ncbi:MAG: NAD(P)-dependent alcohol dehydrogenase [Thiotrichales bacterium]|nr:NAD(P)-dependent alcohol dehydrogenase [Thiotrichales bacterium]